MGSLDGRVSLIGPSDRRLVDVVAGDSCHQPCLLLRVAISEGERDHVEAAGNILHFAIVDSHEIRDEPAAQSFS